MASQYVIDLGYNDTLQTVIKKCNANFKAVMSQQSKQDQINRSDATAEVEDIVARVVGDAVESLSQQIDDEATARRGADDDLDDRIDALILGLPDTISAAILATHPIGSAYPTFGNEDPGTVIGGTWSNVGTIAVGTNQMKIWKRTA